MKILLRICAALFALGLLAGVVYLGILSGQDNKYVVWFGIASAIAAPIGLSALGYALARSDSELIQRLAKVPEIERLVAEAKTQEEKVRVLEAEQARLSETIRLESRRQATRDRIESLERDGMRMIQELDALSDELRNLDDAVGKSIASEEIERLRERVRAREQGDVVVRIGTRIYRIDRDIVKAFPFGMGNFMLAYFRLFNRLQRILSRRKAAEEASPA